MEQFIASTDRLCAEIAKLNTILEQRLPVNSVPSNTVPATPAGASAAPPSAQTPQPGSLYAQWLIDNICTVSKWADEQSISGSGILEYLSAHGLLDILKDSPTQTIRSDGPIYHAAKNGHLDVIKWIVSIDSDQNIGRCAQVAAEEGHLDILKYIHTEYPNIGLRAGLAVTAAAHGHLHIIEWFEDTIEELSGITRANAQWDAAAYGHVHVLKYLMTVRGTGVNQHLLEMCAANGHLDILQLVFIHDKSSVVDIPALIKAAESQPHIVDWIRRFIE